MSELELMILTILRKKKRDEHIHLRGQTELEPFSRDEIVRAVEKLTDEGYLSVYRTDQMIEVDNSLVNYFYNLTESGHDKISRIA